MNKIPSLNLKDFTQGSEQKRIQFVKDLGKAYEEIGVVAISGNETKMSLIEVNCETDFVAKK